MKEIKAQGLKNGFPIALVVSRFNEEITHPLLMGTLERLEELGIGKENITITWVPGAVEIPVVAQRLALMKNQEAIIVLGAVIRGETPHFDYVCEQVSQGCQRVALDHHVPVIFGVLTTEDDDQAKARIGGKHGHKGREAADAAYEMVSVLQQVRDMKTTRPVGFVHES